MPQAQGEVREIWLEPGLDDRPLVAGRIACPPGLLPAPGQYILARAPELSAAPLPVTLFASRVENDTLVAAPALPAAWLPGMRLDLRGPIGRGFDLPAAARHLALACSGLPHRLLGLVERALSRGCEVVLFCDAPLPSGLPTALEITPLGELEANRGWPDFLAVDLDLTTNAFFATESTENTEKNKSRNTLSAVVKSFPCPGQALVHTAMPCAGIAECGACAVRTRKGWKLACKDGPVFDLSELELER